MGFDIYPETSFFCQLPLRNKRGDSLPNVSFALDTCGECRIDVKKLRL